MEEINEAKPGSFGVRLGLALKVLFNGQFAGQIAQWLKQRERITAAPSPEQTHASGLLLLTALQREGRLLDFIQQDVASFSDEEVGAAARVVHGGCRKLLLQYFEFEPAVKEAEGSQVTVPKGFDPQRWRLTGNVSGEPPFRGTLRHHGWVARQIRLPAVSETVDPRVLAPAELELP